MAEHTVSHTVAAASVTVTLGPAHASLDPSVSFMQSFNTSTTADQVQEHK